MNIKILSPVEKVFFEMSGVKEWTTSVPYIIVENFPTLGKFVALRFLEWVAENPQGVISLPTGKTPEFFIKWTKHYLQNWDDRDIREDRRKYGLKTNKKPDLSKLHFVQIDEFYPISPEQHNSFFYYVNNFYIKDFGLDPKRALLMNCEEIPLAEGRHFRQIFPNYIVDLSLRYKEPKTAMERLQQQSIFMIDDWCSSYEEKIRDMGGIGFFLGGLGPDGHIAFNTRGSDHHSNTRLTSTNFETQAQAAGDLGGIEISRNRLVITIGLDTLVYNPDVVAIIFAAGEAKAEMVRKSLESSPTNIYPATVLQKIPNSRFYLTKGAASRLHDRIQAIYKSGKWTHQNTERVVIELCKKIDKYGHRLTKEDLESDPYCKLIPGLNNVTVQGVEDSIIRKIQKGMEPEKNQIFLHTGPHHDDIMLGLFPYITHHLREASNKFHFAIMTSGFTAVTNTFIKLALIVTKRFLDLKRIEMVKYHDFFESGYKFKWDKDVYHYLDKVAANDAEGQQRGLSHRIVRAIVDLYNVKDEEDLRDRINEIIAILNRSYDGEKNPPKIQQLKGMIREFEEELVWSHFGVQVKNIEHLRLGFYTGDIFTEQPTRQRDSTPVLEMMRRIKPTVVSLALDPEGSGPDTHYKVLQAIADALRMYKQGQDVSGIRIWGYRNVWYRFRPSEAEVIVPVSLNSMSVLNDSFKNCYMSQVEASFPSHEYDGPFSEQAQRIWVEQMKDIQYLLGKDFFYRNPHPRLRATHGLVFLREMKVDEFLREARELERTMEG